MQVYNFDALKSDEFINSTVVCTAYAHKNWSAYKSTALKRVCIWSKMINQWVSQVACTETKFTSL